MPLSIILQTVVVLTYSRILLSTYLNVSSGIFSICFLHNSSSEPFCLSPSLPHSPLCLLCLHRLSARSLTPHLPPQPSRGPCVCGVIPWRPWWGLNATAAPGWGAGSQPASAGEGCPRAPASAPRAPSP